MLVYELFQPLSLEKSFVPDPKDEIATLIVRYLSEPIDTDSCILCGLFQRETHFFPDWYLPFILFH